MTRFLDDETHAGRYGALLRDFLHAAGTGHFGQKRCKPLSVDTRPVLMSTRKNGGIKIR
ncbi:hypothetical protein [Nitrosomonas oligotropha]|uniref:hypothetical protein n=1 Tax=Nitrosomonas oligotropha TaxID=42354 RepID=UPI0015E7B6C5|nr:hypothetical protein [Nitrosomonas oligotropha]